MNTHLSFALTRSERTLSQDCSSKAFAGIEERLELIFNNTKDLNIIRKDIETCIKDSVKESYFSNAEITFRNYSKSYSPNRHDFELTNENGDILWINAMSNKLRRLTPNYTDHLPLACFLAGIHFGNIEAARDYHKEFTRKKILRFSKNLAWYQKECLPFYEKYKNTKGLSNDLSDVKFSLKQSSKCAYFNLEVLFLPFLNLVDEIRHSIRNEEDIFNSYNYKMLDIELTKIVKTLENI